MTQAHATDAAATGITAPAAATAPVLADADTDAVPAPAPAPVLSNADTDAAPLPPGLTAADLAEVCRQLILVRTMDERIWMMNRQGKVPIAASAQGHEAAQLGSLLAARKDGDCFLFPYYRDLAVKMAAGLTPRQVMLSFMGKAGDPYSGARQFPLQGADLPRRIIQISNVVAASLTQSVGYALGCRMLGDNTVTLCYFGDGATSQGETHEAMNFAAIHRLPIVFICENNKFAISTPQAAQMVISDVAARADSYGFPGLVVDGMDVIACYEATRQGIDHARRAGPSLIEMKVERFMPHTTDDDDRRYRDRAALDAARAADPVAAFPAAMVAQGILTQQQLDNLRADAQQQVNDATDFADAAPPPDAATIHNHLYAQPPSPC